MTVNAGHRVEFAVYGIHRGEYVSPAGASDTGEIQADLAGLPVEAGGARSFSYDGTWRASGVDSSMHAKVLKWDVPFDAEGDYYVTFTANHGGVAGQSTVRIHVNPEPARWSTCMTPMG
jgi:hypothetical protein